LPGFEWCLIDRSATAQAGRSPKPLRRQPSSAGVFEHPIKAGSLIATFSATDASIVVLLDNLPAAALCNLAELAQLIFNGLLVGRYADVNCCPFLHVNLR